MKTSRTTRISILALGTCVVGVAAVAYIAVLPTGTPDHASAHRHTARWEPSATTNPIPGLTPSPVVEASGEALSAQDRPAAQAAPAAESGAQPEPGPAEPGAAALPGGAEEPADTTGPTITPLVVSCSDVEHFVELIIKIVDPADVRAVSATFQAQRNGEAQAATVRQLQNGVYGVRGSADVIDRMVIRATDHLGNASTYIARSLCV